MSASRNDGAIQLRRHGAGSERTFPINPFKYQAIHRSSLDYHFGQESNEKREGGTIYQFKYCLWLVSAIAHVREDLAAPTPVSP